MAQSPRPKIKASLLKRSTEETKFYVDYEWWEKSELDLKSYLFTRLPIEEDATLEIDTDEVDLVDENTGEVYRVDGFQYMVKAYFNQLPEDFATRTSLVDAVFCVLLANANQPLPAKEIAQRVHRPVDTILKTIGGPKVYQGIRPVLED